MITHCIHPLALQIEQIEHDRGIRRRAIHEASHCSRAQARLLPHLEPVSLHFEEVLCEPEDLDDMSRDQQLYVGISRARNHCVVSGESRVEVPVPAAVD